VLVTVGVAPDPVWSTTTYSAQATLVEYVLNLGVPVAIAAGAWLAGSAMRARQRYAEAMLERAAARDRTRTAESGRAVAEERARIAGELHDVVTHTVAVMVVQAAAADAVWDRDPVQARAAVRAVEESGRIAMADLRGMLGTMRADGGGGERLARPGIEQLPALVDRVRTTGLGAQLTVSGPAGELTPAISSSLLRIAQESVTNALRHARASAIAIDVVIGAESVQLSVADDGIGYDDIQQRADVLDPQRRGGRGLLGMRERARAMSGSLEVSGGTDRGTVVTVRFPRCRDGRT
jgi:signal transduction histidine kinase